jgi:hypothetical protein
MVATLLLGQDGCIGYFRPKNDEAYELRELQTPYNHVFDPKKARLRQNNTYFCYFGKTPLDFYNILKLM